MRNRKNVIMIVLCIVGVFMATGYAILSTKLSINGTSTLTGSWGIRITSITSSATGRAYNISDPTYQDTSMAFEVGVKEPGDKMTFTVEVENFGNIGAILNSIDASASGAEGIVYSIDGIQEQERLAAGAKKKFTITTEFDINATKLPDIPVKELTVKLNYIQDDDQELNPVNPEISDEIITLPTLSSKILSDNIAYADNVRSPYVNSDNGIDFSQVASAENGQGLYYTNKNTDGGKTTYYFRGNVENNYAQIGEDVYETKGVCSVNDPWFENYFNSKEYLTDIDYSMRHFSDIKTQAECEAITDACNFNLPNYIYRGSACDSGPADHGVADENFVDVETKWYTIEELVSEALRFRIIRINEDGSVRLMSTNAKVLPAEEFYNYEAKLQTWYDEYQLSKYASNLISDNFCIDTSVSASGDYIIYGAYDRIIANKSPKFSCPVAKSSGYVDLISADEVAYAGGVYDQIIGGYLSSYGYVAPHIDSNGNYWSANRSLTGSPYNNDVTRFIINSDGRFTLGYPDSSWGLYPVINVKGDVKVISGNGTSEGPYMLKVS